MNIDLSRRSFLKLAGAGVVATSVGALGFGESEAAEIAHVRAFKLKTTTETRNTCPYCSVACGVIIYSKGDPRKGETADIVHIEGDADHPTNRGTLCPKGRHSRTSSSRRPAFNIRCCASPVPILSNGSPGTMLSIALPA